MRILAKGQTAGKCQKEVNRLLKGEWRQVSPIKRDESYIGCRYVAVMEKPDIPGSVKSKFNNYMGV